MASGILSGSPGPLAGGPTSDMSGMLDEEEIIIRISKKKNALLTDQLIL